MDRAIFGARALSEVSRGVPIVFCAEGKRTLVVPVSALDVIDFRAFAKSGMRLAISEERANCIGIAGNSGFALPVDISDQELRDIAWGGVQIKDWGLIPRCHLMLLAISLLKRAHVMPCALMIDLSESCDDLLSFDVSDLANFLEKRSRIVLEGQAEVNLHSVGEVTIFVFGVQFTHTKHIAILKKSDGHIPLVRVHSSCFLGDVLCSAMCDCGEQLQQALQMMHSPENGSNVIIYLDQEGRDIGLVAKTLAYNLQSKGYNTLEANRALGFADDERNFSVASDILRALDINACRLLTNNPKKAIALQVDGIKVIETVPTCCSINQWNRDYMRDKRDIMGHIFTCSGLHIE